MSLFDLSVLLMVLFAGASLIDGVYLHLYKFKLHAREETRREHVIHGLRAALMIPTLLFVLSGATSGFWLWVGVAFVALDVAVTIADVMEERGSRDFQDGLPSYELGLHVVLTALHVGAIGTSLAARPAAAWFGQVSSHVEAAALAHTVAIQGLLGGTVLIAALHFALLHRRFQLKTA